MIDKKFDSIIKYLKNRDSVPTIAYKGSTWFYITQFEHDLIKDFLSLIDSIPESEWRTWDEEKALSYSLFANNADSIIRNSVIKE